ncbi:hypothetical protein MLD38_003580 [Melastoma candidum]|uniref:Uncharacterized protein n=1 Tax=Melastoma candidum TaxID=119954 RepID=A0ACB9S3A6_9MYRT|nr:hypothetical protein MLD38_003580 [Melastoma candidum]
MDHQVLMESYGNHAHGWDVPIDMLGSFKKTKMEKEWGSYHQDDYEQYKDKRSFGCFSDQRQQQTPVGSTRVPRNSGSGMQAVFLHGSHPHCHSTKGSVGTGVFLPSGTGSVKKPNKKSGCSTVLLPAGVIQALKLHFDRVDRQSLSKSNSKPCSCCHRTPLQQDGMINNRNGYDNAKQRLRFQIAAALQSQESIRDGEGLPQEWTY